MCARQQPEGELGLGANRIESGCIQDHQPAPKQRVGVVDQRMPPGRHLDVAVAVDVRVVVGRLVVPEPEGACVGHRNAARARDLKQRPRQLVRIRAIEFNGLPCLRLLTQVGERATVQPRLHRQQQQLRRHAVLVADLDRAHRRTPRRSRQHAAPGVGEEHRIDEFGLAARELGDEGDDEPVAGQPQAQRIENGGRRSAFEQLVLFEKAPETCERRRSLRTPVLEGIEPAAKRGVHALRSGSDKLARC